MSSGGLLSGVIAVLLVGGAGTASVACTLDIDVCAGVLVVVEREPVNGLCAAAAAAGVVCPVVNGAAFPSTSDVVVSVNVFDGTSTCPQRFFSSSSLLRERYHWSLADQVAIREFTFGVAAFCCFNCHPAGRSRFVASLTVRFLVTGMAVTVATGRSPVIIRRENTGLILGDGNGRDCDDSIDAEVRDGADVLVIAEGVMGFLIAGAATCLCAFAMIAVLSLIFPSRNTSAGVSSAVGV